MTRIVTLAKLLGHIPALKIETRSSAITQGPCNVLCQLKSSAVQLYEKSDLNGLQT